MIYNDIYIYNSYCVVPENWGKNVPVYGIFMGIMMLNHKILRHLNRRSGGLPKTGWVKIENDHQEYVRTNIRLYTPYYNLFTAFTQNCPKHQEWYLDHAKASILGGGFARRGTESCEGRHRSQSIGVETQVTTRVGSWDVMGKNTYQEMMGAF